MRKFKIISDISHARKIILIFGVKEYNKITKLNLYGFIET